MESGIDFVAADMPSADRFMLHIYAAMAEEEGRRISERTKAALAAAKERGVELGKNGKVLARANRDAAEVFAKTMETQFALLGITPHTSLAEIAAHLNRAGIKTREGGIWYKVTVARVLKRMSECSQIAD